MELAELRLADALEALYEVRDDPKTSVYLDRRQVALAITSMEEAALWLSASRAQESIPEALRAR